MKYVLDYFNQTTNLSNFDAFRGLFSIFSVQIFHPHFILPLPILKTFANPLLIHNCLQFITIVSGISVGAVEGTFIFFRPHTPRGNLLPFNVNVQDKIKFNNVMCKDLVTSDQYFCVEYTF